jgi:peptidoglycan/xylan/chitin deacetylase (PgdA/CDA1 family)
MIHFIRTVAKKMLSAFILFRMRDERIYLTFDDGPHPLYTPSILDILAERDIRATFFLLGKKIETHPELVAAIAKGGHSIGYHTHEHTRLRKMSYSQLKMELDAMDSGPLARITKHPISLFRPPHGDLTFTSILLFLQRKKKLVHWSVDSRDSFLETDRQVIHELGKIEWRGGEIVLFHDDERHLPAVLPQVVDDLAAQGFRFGAIDE